MTDPQPMWNEIVGRHAYRPVTCDRTCSFLPREGYSQDRADYFAGVRS